MLVILDCDGVLVDTERLANQVFAELVTTAGLPTTYDESIERYMGRSMTTALALVEAALGSPIPRGFVEAYDERIYRAFDASGSPVDGVVGALDMIDALGMATCVASSGSHEKMGRTLGRTGLLARFEGRIFSATEVSRGKPFPDLFLYAAERMGFIPDECVVVEDSPAGVEAAVAAGMQALGYAGMIEAGRLSAAGATTFTAMAQLPGLVCALASER